MTLRIEAEILGSKKDEVEGCTKYVEDGEEIRFHDITIQCLLTPGHTMGHICYFCQDGEQLCVFSGDTLFNGGVGKFFEGTAEDMHGSLQKLIRLPGNTLVYCGHEYTLSNYRFALSVDPENADLIAANNEARVLREEGKFTVPSTIQKELATNPFLRVLTPSIRAHFPALPQDDPIALLGAVREAKNKF
jgi:hydroxyacylglutathione hydrolase